MLEAKASQKLEEQLFLNVIQGRRSVRKFDREAKISQEEITELLQMAMLAPSAANLQPWRFLVIDSPELQQKLLPIAFNQQQVVEASAVIAVLGDLECVNKAERIYGAAVESGFIPAETAAALVGRYTDMYDGLTAAAIREIVLSDCGMVSLQLMLAARAKGYDTVPMGGYDKTAFVKAFGIGDHYVPSILIALGKAAQPGHPTVRLNVDEVAFFNTMPK